MASSTKPTSVQLKTSDQDALFAFVETAAPGTQVEASLNDSDDTTSGLMTRLTLAGFVDVRVDEGTKSPSTVYGRLPDYSSGTTVELRSSNVGVENGIILKANSGTNNQSQFAAILQSNASDIALVDEDALLEADGIQAQANSGVTDAACGTETLLNKRKPCKNCSCGLADIYYGKTDAVQGADASNGDTNDSSATKTKTNVVDKACGNCALGDGFRCASCPYLGLPPFKPGEKVSLSSSLMTSDI